MPVLHPQLQQTLGQSCITDITTLSDGNSHCSSIVRSLIETKSLPSLNYGEMLLENGLAEL